VCWCRVRRILHKCVGVDSCGRLQSCDTSFTALVSHFVLCNCRSPYSSLSKVQLSDPVLSSTASNARAVIQDQGARSSNGDDTIWRTRTTKMKIQWTQRRRPTTCENGKVCDGKWPTMLEHLILGRTRNSRLKQEELKRGPKQLRLNFGVVRLSFNMARNSLFQSVQRRQDTPENW